jgi:hypothetical protein
VRKGFPNKGIINKITAARKKNPIGLLFLAKKSLGILNV